MDDATDGGPIDSLKLRKRGKKKKKRFEVSKYSAIIDSERELVKVQDNVEVYVRAKKKGKDKKRRREHDSVELPDGKADLKKKKKKKKCESDGASTARDGATGNAIVVGDATSSLQEKCGSGLAVDDEMGERRKKKREMNRKRIELAKNEKGGAVNEVVINHSHSNLMANFSKHGEQEEKKVDSAQTYEQGVFDATASNHFEKCSMTSFQKDDEGIKKKKKKNANNDQEGAVYEVHNHFLIKDMAVFVEDEEGNEKKRDNGKTVTSVLVETANYDQMNLPPSANTRDVIEKDVESKIVKKKKMKCNKSDLGGLVYYCEGKGKKTSHLSDKDADETNSSKKLKKGRKNVDVPNSPKTSESKRKRVSFSDQVDIFTLQRGNRYTSEEDVKVLQAIDDYILKHGLAGECIDKDLNENWKRARMMINNCKKYPELKGCWKEISRAMPWRTMVSIYSRAHILYERADDRNWTKEELETVRKFHEEHGPKWRQLGDVLGKSRKHVKDTFRRIKFSNANKGHWSQEEYQKLFDLVNSNIRIRAFEEKKVKYGMLRDNIAWGAIADRIETRHSPCCCRKWYNQLCSSLVVEGNWMTVDDYLLVDALYNLDACCIEDVDWDSLLEHRSGDLCHKRWKEMARNLGDYRQKPFSEQVEILHQRYEPDLVEPVETYAKKVPVDT